MGSSTRRKKGCAEEAIIAAGCSVALWGSGRLEDFCEWRSELMVSCKGPGRWLHLLVVLNGRVVFGGHGGG